MNSLQLRYHHPIPLFIIVFMAIYATCLGEIILNPSIDTEDVSASQITVDEVTYELTAVVDPLMKYQEIDEENNILDLSGAMIEFAVVDEIVLNSSSNRVSISIPVEILSGDQVTAMLYSIDGRVVAQSSAEVTSASSISIDLSSGTSSLPFGCYVVLLNDGNDLIFRRKVLVIE